MGNQIIKSKDLRKLGFKSDKSKSLAINIISKKFKHVEKKEIIEILGRLLENPDKYINDMVLKPIAQELIKKDEPKAVKQITLNNFSLPFKVYGKKNIDGNTIAQMEKAMQLPVSEYGALMPDAHCGYGLPIGGVVATKAAIIPYGVGLDIGCRMSLSIYDASERYLNQHSYKLKTVLKEHTHFGIRNDINFNYEHEVMERDEFNQIEIAKSLKAKAQRQLGTSGSGNHFVEIGLVKLDALNSFGIDEGTYLGILAHSGSRGFGAEVAKHFTNLAMRKVNLPKGYQHLAWLDINDESGREYWQLMNLAGDYAKACHDLIHKSIAKALGLKEIAKVENHHNFAWKEHIGGKEYIVHRKGATPAGNGQLGIIPGTMASPGYIVRGIGNADSLNSASHGAGRKLSRTKAKNSYTKSSLRKLLKQEKITLIDGSVEEAPIAYKDIKEVMLAQKELVNIEGEFLPKIVRMDKA